MSVPTCDECARHGQLRRMIAGGTTIKRALAVWVCPRCDGEAAFRILHRREHG